MEKKNVKDYKMVKAERNINGILRIEGVLANPEKYFNTVDKVAGWIKNIRL